MTDNCNADILAQARANVGERTTPANARAIARGEWDPVYVGGVCVSGLLVHAEMQRLLKQPVIAGGSDD